MSTPVAWHATAFNQATESSNQIHSDEMAKAYGFKGGLVPGVTISAYLMHPAVVAWGVDWLGRGRAQVVVTKPLYDGFEFDVIVSDVSENAYEAVLIDQEGTRCAHASVALNDNPPTPPRRRGDALLVRDAQIPAVSYEVLADMQSRGMHALPARWHADQNMATYLQQVSDMPELLRFDGAGFANGAFMLGLTNWVLAGNTYMNPWVHVQTDSQFFAPVPQNAELVVECAVADLFERKGHKFVDVDVDVYRTESSLAVMSARLRAIYQLRDPAG
jgi:hypothetical protein